MRPHKAPGVGPSLYLTTYLPTYKHNTDTQIHVHILMCVCVCGETHSDTESLACLRTASPNEEYEPEKLQLWDRGCRPQIVGAGWAAALRFPSAPTPTRGPLRCVCLLLQYRCVCLQYLLQSCSRWGGRGRVEDLC